MLVRSGKKSQSGCVLSSTYYGISTDTQLASLAWSARSKLNKVQRLTNDVWLALRRYYIHLGLASSPSENQVQAGDDSLQVPTRMGADILGGRLSGDLHYCGQATPAVCRHRTTLCTQDKDHAGDEEFRGRWSSYLEQSTWHPANCNSLPLDVCWKSEGSPVWFIEGARLRTIYDALYKSTHHHHFALMPYTCPVGDIKVILNSAGAPDLYSYNVVNFAYFDTRINVLISYLQNRYLWKCDLNTENLLRAKW